MGKSIVLSLGNGELRAAALGAHFRGKRPVDPKIVVSELVLVELFVIDVLFKHIFVQATDSKSAWIHACVMHCGNKY